MNSSRGTPNLSILLEKSRFISSQSSRNDCNQRLSVLVRREKVAETERRDSRFPLTSNDDKKNFY